MYNCLVSWYTIADDVSVDKMSVDEMSVDELSWNRSGYLSTSRSKEFTNCGTLLSINQSISSLRLLITSLTRKQRGLKEQEYS